MSHASEILPPPEDPIAFESLCLDVWQTIWQNVQGNGRRGQKQAGVDIIGRHNQSWKGIQCKQKSNLLFKRLTIRELEEEAMDATHFRPQLAELILATTGPADVHILRRARELTDELPFSVAVLSWEEIWREICLSPALLEKLGQRYWPHVWAAVSKSVLVQGTRELEQCGYEILGRVITCNFQTFTTGTTVHEITIRSNQDYVTHYVGRYRKRGQKREMTILTPHKSLRFGETVSAFQKFYFEFPEPLSNRMEKTVIVQHEWEDTEMAITPESTIAPVAQEQYLRMVVNPPKGCQARNAVGYVRQHAGAHAYISRENVSIEGDSFKWEPREMKARLSYQLTWEWVR